ncbi:pyrimidine-nucleoside phosphorylase [Clostridiisalibacter paucivorans]|uniref:pyrimidine-nucleoside phosphorylase n=1 Tax=Clostridiisalibacter paucivorans TaxID=408753 RepID=UPI00047D5DE7|nr:pyrimidine-nucleoside phosphorylase [Clostridiisalibacter paucivorans]
MRIYDIIKKKRDGFSLTKSEINFFINGYTKGNIEDYQISSLLMAIFLNKMNMEETANLTEAMINSGEQVDLSSIDGIKVDKHSTGGVGDKTTLVLGPMVAACGLPVAKMSGRGLGHTGGTLDKLESIKGFNVALTKNEFINNVNKIKLSICGQTANIAPADKKLYALRDVTATVDNISLIASSIMSKKLASGSDAIVLDVKVGNGAFMKTIEQASQLAKVMVEIGTRMNKKVIALLSNMNQPLGKAVGNALEVKEAIDTLNNNGPEDLVKLCLNLGSYLLYLGGIVNNIDDGKNKLAKTLKDGSALNKFIEMVNAQGGNEACIKNTGLLPKAKYIVELKSQASGYIKNMYAEEIGKAALTLGAGRDTKEGNIDLSVGIVLNKKISDKINKGEVLAYVHGNDMLNIEKSIHILENAIDISKTSIEEEKLIMRIIDKDNIKLF